MNKTDPPQICSNGGKISDYLRTMIRRKIKSEILILCNEYKNYLYILSEKK